MVELHYARIENPPNIMLEYTQNPKQTQMSNSYKLGQQGVILTWRIENFSKCIFYGKCY
jgi:hypothetical protein